MRFSKPSPPNLLGAGVPVNRITTGVPILHPNLWSFSGLWEAGVGASERRYRPGAPDVAASLENGPIKIVYEGGGPVRCDPQHPTEGRRDRLNCVVWSEALLMTLPPASGWPRRC